MDLLLYIIIFLSVLIVSNATNKLFPSLPTPLIQILLGIGLGFFIPVGTFHLETELFLALIIGPLLFREAEESDITSILKHWKIVIYLIFPVIFLSTLSLGFLSHWLWVSLPLAACIAVGAALGPTDLVAFASLSERFTFPKRVENILKGEGLLNDASGLVAFQFALTAWTTGQIFGSRSQHLTYPFNHWRFYCGWSNCFFKSSVAKATVYGASLRHSRRTVVRIKFTVADILFGRRTPCIRNYCSGRGRDF